MQTLLVVIVLSALPLVLVRHLGIMSIRDAETKQIVGEVIRIYLGVIENLAANSKCCEYYGVLVLLASMR